MWGDWPERVALAGETAVNPGLPAGVETRENDRSRVAAAKVAWARLR